MELDRIKLKHVYNKVDKYIQEDLYYPHSFIQDLLWDGLHYFSEPLLKKWPFSKLREKGLKRVVDLMRYGAEESRFICLGCVDKASLYLNMLIDILNLVLDGKKAHKIISLR